MKNKIIFYNLLLLVLALFIGYCALYIFLGFAIGGGLGFLYGFSLPIDVFVDFIKHLF